SVYARKPRDAILLTYLVMIAYLLISLLMLVPMGYLQPDRLPGTSIVADNGWRDTPFHVLEGFSTGNPVIMLLDLREEWDTGTPLAEALPQRLRSYAVFHMLIAIACGTWAVGGMRSAAWVAPRPRDPDATSSSWRRWRLIRPSLGKNP